MVIISLFWLSQCQVLGNTWHGVPGTECYQGARERGWFQVTGLWLPAPAVQYAAVSWGSGPLISKPCPQKLHFHSLCSLESLVSVSLTRPPAAQSSSLVPTPPEWGLRSQPSPEFTTVTRPVNTKPSARIHTQLLKGQGIQTSLKCPLTRPSIP